ncbi:MAG: hypothetical protein HY040_14170 [Planctomycetes bacterium]|nr:hypothetical protein [Planctomycetota bacterium]
MAVQASKALRADAIGQELRAELRSIICQFIDLRKPFDTFELEPARPSDGPRYYVNFTRRPHRKFTGLRLSSLGTLRTPNERVMDSVCSVAKSVWHLKDRLHQWLRATKTLGDVDAWAKTNEDLLVCADLANWKKHGRTENRSGLSPKLTGVAYDTSRSGPLEMFYDGAIKEEELLVTNPVPIAYRVEMAYSDGRKILDAVEVVHLGFRHWIPFIQKHRILGDDTPESKVLRETLFE